MPRTLRAAALVTSLALLAPAASVHARGPGLAAPGPALSIPLSGQATPYPYVFTVANRTGTIADIDVTLEGVTHSFADDIDLLLVSPSGTRVVLLSDACGDPDLVGVTLTLDDEAGAAVPEAGPCAGGGTLMPSDYAGGPVDAFPEPAPSGPHGSSLSAFDGEPPNGLWSVYAVDDNAGDSGEIGGVTLSITTNPAAIAIPAGPGAANPYPAVTHVGIGRPVTDVGVALTGGSHTYLADLDVLLVGPTGASVQLMSDACGSADLIGTDLVFDDEAPGGLPERDGRLHRRRLPADRPRQRTGRRRLPAAGARRAVRLGAVGFDGTDPDGPWKLFVYDDTAGDGGFFATGFRLDVATRDGGPVEFAAPTATAVEGRSLALALTRGILPPGLLAGSVTVTTTGGTAEAGSDFEPVSQTVDFGAGQTSAAVQVPVHADSGAEGAETFTVALSDPRRDAALGAIATMTVLIPADPAPPPAAGAPAARPLAKSPPLARRSVLSAGRVVRLPSSRGCVRAAIVDAAAAAQAARAHDHEHQGLRRREARRDARPRQALPGVHGPAASAPCLHRHGEGADEGTEDLHAETQIPGLRAPAALSRRRVGEPLRAASLTSRAAPSRRPSDRPPARRRTASRPARRGPAARPRAGSS